LYFRIDHWDNEREKIVILAEDSVLIFRYNFINSKVLDKKRIFLHTIDRVMVGDFKYPDYSLMP